VTYFVRRVVTSFNEIVKATYVRSKAIYKLKIIVRTSSIIDQLLGLKYAPVAALWLGLALGLASSKGSFGCNFILNMEAPYLTEMELKSEYEVVVR
jgi:hypothetical protein